MTENNLPIIPAQQAQPEKESRLKQLAAWIKSRPKRRLAVIAAVLLSLAGLFVLIRALAAIEVNYQKTIPAGEELVVTGSKLPDGNFAFLLQIEPETQGDSVQKSIQREADGTFSTSTTVNTPGEYTLKVVQTEEGGTSGGLTAPTNFSASGSQILLDGKPFRPVGFNWEGLGGFGVPNLLSDKSLDDILAFYKSLGINTIRLPLSNEMIRATDPVMNSEGTRRVLTRHAGGNVGWIGSDTNPDLLGLTPLEIMGVFLDKAAKHGIFVILDNHSADSGSRETQPRWFDSNSNWANSHGAWLEDWKMLAEKYGNHPAVMGFDLYNEPRKPTTWDEWATAAEEAGNMILEIAPDKLIIVEGTEGNVIVPDLPLEVKEHGSRWGGYLAEVRNRPVRLNVSNRLVYSPHDYGNAVGERKFLGGASGEEGLRAHMQLVRAFWGFIAEENIAPLIVGETGLGRANGDNPDSRDIPYIQALNEYMNRFNIGVTYWGTSGFTNEWGLFQEKDKGTHVDRGDLDALRALANQQYIDLVKPVLDQATPVPTFSVVEVLFEGPLTVTPKGEVPPSDEIFITQTERIQVEGEELGFDAGDQNKGDLIVIPDKVKPNQPVDIIQGSDYDVKEPRITLPFLPRPVLTGQLFKLFISKAGRDIQKLDINEDILDDGNFTIDDYRAPAEEGIYTLQVKLEPLFGPIPDFLPVVPDFLNKAIPFGSQCCGTATLTVGDVVTPTPTPTSPTPTQPTPTQPTPTQPTPTGPTQPPPPPPPPGDKPEIDLTCLSTKSATECPAGEEFEVLGINFGQYNGKSVLLRAVPKDAPNEQDCTDNAGEVMRQRVDNISGGGFKTTATINVEGTFRVQACPL